MLRRNGLPFCAMLTFLAAIKLPGCDTPPPAAGPPPTPEVAVVVLSPESVLLTTELPGRTTAYLEAEIRPQVNGIIQSREFEEGRDVAAGEILYQIDPARYQALYAQTQAALAVAQAQVPALRARAERSAKALGDRAVSQQDCDEAVAALKVGEATVDLRAAEMESARINLSYTRITAPISGRIGKSDVTVGSLVTANQPAALATIRQFDPIYVDVMQSSTELLRLKRVWASGELTADEKELRTVRLILEDGTPYPIEGHLQFRDIAVDPTTGSYNLRVVFPNPQHLLLPGAFVWAVVQEGTAEEAILVPQQGITRNTKGEPVALIADKDDVVRQVVVTLDRAIGNRWLISGGLTAGDRLIVEGLQKIRPGVKARVVPFVENDRKANAETAASSQPQPDSKVTE